jgi:hypothetical protein
VVEEKSGHHGGDGAADHAPEVEDDGALSLKIGERVEIQIVDF